MADNYVANAGTGGSTFASDDIGGIHHPRIKNEWGADGAAADVSVAAPMPVQASIETSQMTVAGTVVAPKYAVIDAATSGDNTLVAANATKKLRVLAAFLAAHKGAKSVNYPGLPDHPHHELAQRQARGFGAVISFDTGSLERADQVLKSVRVFTLAESLGGVESLISHPASMTHGSVPDADKLKLGVTPGLVRISVGIEDVEDLVADLDRALR